jgi:hypothetical protein
MQLCAAEQIDQVDIGPCDRRFRVPAIASEPEAQSRLGGTLDPQIANLDELEPSDVAQLRQHRQVEQRRRLACTDDESAGRPHVGTAHRRGN